MFLRRLVLALVAALLLALSGASLSRPAPAAAATATPTPASAGYWLAAADGGVFAFGGAPFLGSTGNLRLNRPVVAMAATPTGRGYWLAASDGGVFAFGDARFFGSTGGQPLARPVVAIAGTPSGAGYWLAAGDGSVFAFGDAGFFGSAAAQRLRRPVVGMAVTPTNGGYWLVTEAGEVFAFGDAVFAGATPPLRERATGISATPSGRGYWITAADGGVFAFGDAAFVGSVGGRRLTSPVVGGSGAPRGAGYWLVATDGGVFAFGDAAFAGSTGGQRLVAPVVGMASRPVVLPPQVGAFFYPWYAVPDGVVGWRHWEQNGKQPPKDIGANFYPAGGVYSSRDPATLGAQARAMAAAGFDQVISSWWGRNALWDDIVLPRVASAVSAAGLELVIHLEPYGGRSPDTVASDLAYLRQFGVRDVYLYEIEDRPPQEWAAVVARFPEYRFFAETGNLPGVVSGAFARYATEAGFDGIYTYDAVRYETAELAWACASARAARLLCAPSVAPGYDARRATADLRVVDPAGGRRYENHWAAALAAGADAVTVTSWNEWHEGTQIEPAVPYCFPDGFCSPGYEGVYGRFGPAAERAYLDRTRDLAAAFRARG